MLDQIRARWGYLRPQLLAQSALLKLLNKLSLIPMLYGVLARQSASYPEWVAFWLFIATACAVWGLDQLDEARDAGGDVNPRWVSRSVGLKLINKLTVAPILAGLMYRVGAGFAEWAAFVVFTLTAFLIWTLDHVIDVDGSGD